MDDKVINQFAEARRLSTLAYIQFLEKYNFFDFIKSPTAPERIYYELQWNERAGKVVNYILKFLNQEKIVKLDGEIVSLGQKYEKFKEQNTDSYLNYSSQNQVAAFLKYGISLLQEIIDGGNGSWDLENQIYKLESGLVVPHLRSFQVIVQDVLQNIEEKFPSICLIGPGAELYISSVEPYIEEPSQVWILEISDLGIDRALAFLDLEPKTSYYSKNVYNVNDVINKEFDMVYLANLFEFFTDMDHWARKINQLLSPKGKLILNLPMIDNMALGIEPLYLFIEGVKKLPSSEDLKKFLKVGGFTSITPDPHLSFIWHVR